MMSKEQDIEKIQKYIGGCPYDKTVFPTTIEEAGKFLERKGLSTRDISAISGCIARLGWNNALLAAYNAGLRFIPDELPLLGEEEIIRIVTEYHISGIENRHVLAKRVAQAQRDLCMKTLKGE